jgi:hypothetical protein
MLALFCVPLWAMIVLTVVSVDRLNSLIEQAQSRPLVTQTLYIYSRRSGTQSTESKVAPSQANELAVLSIVRFLRSIQNICNDFYIPQLVTIKLLQIHSHGSWLFLCTFLGDISTCSLLTVMYLNG